jgi:hypothetical protein
VGIYHKILKLFGLAHPQGLESITRFAPSHQKLITGGLKIKAGCKNGWGEAELLEEVFLAELIPSLDGSFHTPAR